MTPSTDPAPLIISDEALAAFARGFVEGLFDDPCSTCDGTRSVPAHGLQAVESGQGDWPCPECSGSAAGDLPY